MVKRLFDIGFSLGWLIFFSPLLAGVALLVRLKLGSLFYSCRNALAGTGSPLKS